MIVQNQDFNEMKIIFHFTTKTNGQTFLGILRSKTNDELLVISQKLKY